MNSATNELIKEVVSVAEMSRMVGLSRARFYQLQKSGVFPVPAYSITTRRPVYTAEQQRLVLEARRRNCGINGQPVLFYARRIQHRPAQARSRSAVARTSSQHVEIVESLRELGLTGITPAQVVEAMREAFPQGTISVGKEEQIRQVFLHLRQNSIRKVAT